jgi:hypothetical protein
MVGAIALNGRRGSKLLVYIVGIWRRFLASVTQFSDLSFPIEAFHDEYPFPRMKQMCRIIKRHSMIQVLA